MRANIQFFLAEISIFTIKKKEFPFFLFSILCRHNFLCN